MTLRPDTIRPPAEVRKRELAKSETYRHRHSRRIFKVVMREPDRDVVTVSTRSGRRARRISHVELVSTFTRVVPCGTCGCHHDVRRQGRHQ